MKVFVTGASGFIGSAVVKELLAAGHEVTGLARSDEAAGAIAGAGAHVLRGSLEDLEALRRGALQADGIVHTAFVHDFSRFASASELDKAAIAAMGMALEGTDKPIVVAGGLLGVPHTAEFTTEADASPDFPRASEAAAMALAERGVNAAAVRLPPSVHGTGDKGFVPFIIAQARRHRIAACVEDGSNRWPAVHSLDAARLFRLAVEKGIKGARYNAVADEGVKIREIAEVIGKKLGLPVKSLSGEDAVAHFEWMSRFIGFDAPATSHKTQELLSWKPRQAGLIEDMEENYF